MIDKVRFEHSKSDGTYIQVNLWDVKLRVEWDLDGDTRYPGSPKYAYLDTGGAWTKIALGVRTEGGFFGLGGGAVVKADGFQVQRKFDWKGMFSVFTGGIAGAAVDSLFKVNGEMCVFGGGGGMTLRWAPGGTKAFALPLVGCKFGEW